MAGVYDRLVESVRDGTTIEEIEPSDPIIEGVIDRNSLAALYGRSGIGKSAIAHSMALSVATNRHWFGHQVEHNDVLYIVAEGQSGIGTRQIAWRTQHKVDRVEGIQYMTVAPNLMQSEDRMAILRYVEEEYAGFVILDTLARHIPGGDENTGPVMSAVVETMEAIKRETEGCVMVVHHTGWSDGERLRGHSSLEGALDHAFAVLPHSPNSQDGRIKIRAQKHKNHPDHYTLLNLQLTEVAGAVALEEDTTLSDSERETLEALVSRLRETNGSAPLGLKSHEWEEVAPVARATFYRCKARLLSLGEVQHKDGYWSCLT